MKEYVERFFRLAICTLFIVSLHSIAAAAPSPKAYGLGHPFTLEELPFGDFRTKLESLPESARNRAMAWLHNFQFMEHDLPFLRIDRNGGVFYADTFTPAESDLGEASGVDSGGSMTAPNATDVFSLHSRPGASKVLYLDFDGHLISGTAWSSVDLQARPYDTNGDPSVFGDTELANIAEIWRRVAEDFAPFDVDITTAEPASFGPSVGRVLITSDDDANGNAMPAAGAGGVAYINVWGRSDYSTRYSPALVYYNNLGGGRSDYVSEAASHEAGHNLALSHDATSSSSYYNGHGSGNVSWGPIMGTGYNRNVSQWSKGEYIGASNQQDDVSILDSKLASRIDDHADYLNGATRIVFDVAGNVVGTTPQDDPYNLATDNKGVIEAVGDLDVFYFDSSGGLVELAITPARQKRYTLGGNLDIYVALYDSNGTMLQSDDSLTDTKSLISANLLPGRYYLSVHGVGNGVSPYSDYGSLGQYFISGTLAVITDDIAPVPSPMSWAIPPQSTGRNSASMTATTAYDASGVVEYRFECLSGPAGCTTSAWQMGVDYLVDGLLPGSTYEFRVIARDAYLNMTLASVTASVTTDANLAPTALNDSAEVGVGASVNIDVLVNDSDQEGDSLFVVSTTQGINGSVTNNNNSITYTPNAGYIGVDSFSYSISDGFGGTAAASVSIMVSETNNAPVANADSVAINRGDTVSINILVNDTDPDGDPLTITDAFGANKGALLWQPGQTTVTYVHNAKRKGSDSFSYQISDGRGGVATGTVSISLNSDSGGGTGSGKGRKAR